MSEGITILVDNEREFYISEFKSKEIIDLIEKYGMEIPNFRDLKLS